MLWKLSESKDLVWTTCWKLSSLLTHVLRREQNFVLKWNCTGWTFWTSRKCGAYFEPDVTYWFVFPKGAAFVQVFWREEVFSYTTKWVTIDSLDRNGIGCLCAVDNCFTWQHEVPGKFMGSGKIISGMKALINKLVHVGPVWVPAKCLLGCRV